MRGHEAIIDRYLLVPLARGISLGKDFAKHCS